MRSMSLNRYRLSSIPLCIGQPSEFTHLFIHHLSIFNVISGMLKRVLFKRCRLRLINRRPLSPKISLRRIFLIQSLRGTGLNDPALWSGGWLGGIYLIDSIDLSSEDRVINLRTWFDSVHFSRLFRTGFDLTRLRLNEHARSMGTLLSTRHEQCPCTFLRQIIVLHRFVVTSGFDWIILRIFIRWIQNL
jgi:hypothetical protein